jgi:hypothetical protein
MLRRLQNFLVLLAWLLATGCQWDLVQTFAWGRMTVANAQTMPLTAAITRTFTPDNMCPVCRAVATAKQQQEQSHNAGVPGGRPDGKILVVVSPAALVVAPVLLQLPWLEHGGMAAGASRAAPPLPPPRAA